MKQDFSELIEYLDKKFIETAKQKDLNELKEEVRSLVTSIDGLTKSIEIYHDEQKAISAKMDIHEKWIKQLAKKIGLELRGL